MNLVVIIALLAVVIIQIVILSNQKKNIKLIRDFITEKNTQRNDKERSHDRRDGNTNRNRRSGSMQSGPKQTATQASSATGNVDNVEKSLRDINLKLKHVERDQEAARRKMNDGIGGESQSQRSRSSRGNRSGKGRDRNSHRGNYRGNKNDSRGNENRSRSSDQRSNKKDGSSDDNSKPSATQQASLPDLKPVDFDADMQHGRKVSVKRRALQDESAKVGQVDRDAYQKELDQATENGSQTMEHTVNTAEDSKKEISFGRR